jgi:predicted nucleic acid-binding protein
MAMKTVSLREAKAGFSSSISQIAFFLDVAVALAAGEMADAATAKGRDRRFADILIAATANAHGLTLVTRNIKPFEHLDVAMQPPAGDS